MVRFDKLKLLLPLNAIEVNDKHPDWHCVYAPDEYGEITLQRLTYGNQKEQRTRHRPHVGYNGKHKGINYISVNYEASQVEIVMSGKVLDNPSLLLSTETIEQAWNSVNETGLIYIYAIHVLPPQLLAADITADCVMSNSPSTYTNLVTRYYVGKDFKEVREYTPNIQLQHKAKTAKHTRTLTGYDKNLESENNSYFSPNTLRWELRLISFQQLRKYLKLLPGAIMLLDALESKANPIYDIFQELLSGIQLSPAMKTLEAPAPNMTTETRAALFAAQELTFNERAIFARLKELALNLSPLEAELKGDKNRAIKLKPYREVFTRWQAFSANNCNDINLLKELIDKLKLPAIHKTLSETIQEYA